MTMTTWVTVSQASGILGMSERSIRRHAAEGKLESRLEGARRLVRVDVPDDNPDIIGMPTSDKDALIRWLKNELEERNKQMNLLQEEMRLGRERSDEIIMRLADELEAQRNILEGRPPRRKRDESFWRRLRRGEINQDE
ncbi:hypothetical protein ACFL6S_14350 [Candidatus Poribacteria bacterium]